MTDSLGNQQVIATKSVFDPTEPEGFWTATTSNVPPGSYTAFAEVLVRKSKKGTCKAAKSDTTPIFAG